MSISSSNGSNYIWFNDAASSSDYVAPNMTKWNAVAGSRKGLTWNPILTLAWRDWGKRPKYSVKQADLQAKIWTWRATREHDAGMLCLVQQIN
jgi:hypothetical protein